MTGPLPRGEPPPQPQRMLVPVVTPDGVPKFPLLLVLGYVAGTFLLFLTWPIDWPIYFTSEWVWLTGYVVVCLAAIWLAMRMGTAGPTPVTAPLPWLTPLLLAGAMLSGGLLIPLSFAYTGHGPWDVLEALRDQGAAYRRLQLQLYATEGQRNVIVALRSISAPLVYAALPLGIIHWQRIGWIGRLSVGVAVMSSVTFSIMRGTDKEIADLFVVGMAALFVSFGRARVQEGSAVSVIARYWKPILLALVFLYLAQGLFTQRKDERLGGYSNRAVVCANDSRICADLDNPMIAWLPLRQRFGLTVFILSTCSGYYGLKLSMEKPFESAMGVGHSPAALSIYEVITGDDTLHKRTFTYRNGENRWSEEFYWSTLIAWIANDVGFAGAVAVLALIGFLWGLWWREAVAGTSDPAAVLFAMATTMMFYLPANNQVFASYEGYFVLAAWVAVWLWHRSQRRLFAALSVPLARPA